jgi:hypothetical protein
LLFSTTCYLLLARCSGGFLLLGNQRSLLGGFHQPWWNTQLGVVGFAKLGLANLGALLPSACTGTLSCHDISPDSNQSQLHDENFIAIQGFLGKTDYQSFAWFGLNHVIKSKNCSKNSLIFASVFCF